MQCRCLAILEPDDAKVELGYGQVWEVRVTCDDCGAVYYLFIDTDTFVAMDEDEEYEE